VADVVLAIENLVKHYSVKVSAFRSERLHAVDGVSLAVRRGETLGLVGESGCGKTTTGRCILLLERPTAGEIVFLGRDLATLNRKELRMARRQIGMVFQEYNLVERLSVIENVLCGRLGFVPLWRTWSRRIRINALVEAMRRIQPQRWPSPRYCLMLRTTSRNVSCSTSSASSGRRSMRRTRL